MVAERGEVGARKRIGSSATYKHLPSALSSYPRFYLVTRSLVRHPNSPITFLSFRSIMYRGSFAPPPAQSPPLHHPVPQHVSTVPMMRSPPPPVPQQPPSAGYGGNPYQPSPAQGGSGSYAPGPGFGGFMNEPTAQMGFQVGKTAMAAGQEYMESNVRNR